MWNFKIYLFLFLIFVLIFETVNSACTISARNQVPLFIKSFGSKKIILPKEIHEVKLESDEAIQAHCSSSISFRTDYNTFIQNSEGISGIELYCNGSMLRYVGLGGSYTAKYSERNAVYVSCENAIQSLYESKKQFPNCEKYLSYAIGIAPNDNPQIVSAAICYDLDKLSVKYVNYLAYRSKYTFSEPKNNATLPLAVSLDTALMGFNNLFNFMSAETFKTNFNTKKLKNTLLELQNFDYESLVQDRTLQAELKGYEKMFKIIWWQNLRMGNWRYFQTALEKQAEHTTFSIYTGISGTLVMPDSECEREEVFTVASMETIVKAPALIWSFIKSDKQEFVVVANNSPFLLLQNETLSCKDVCHEIDWLAKSLFGRTHLIPNLGLVHCCHAAEVADKLDNFPLKSVKPKPKSAAETTQTPGTTKQPHSQAKPKHTKNVSVKPLDMAN